MLIFTVIGARPQFIKAAAVSKAFKKINEEIQKSASSVESYTITEI